MKHLEKATLLCLSFSLLAACQTTTSEDHSSTNLTSDMSSSVSPDTSSTSSEDVVETLSYRDAISLLTKLAASEGNASQETYQEKVDKSGFVTTLTKELSLYSDHTSVGTGTLTKKNGDNPSTSTTFKEATETRKDTFQFTNFQQECTMLYHALDYQDDSITGGSYQDEATRQFVVASTTEANTLGLAQGQYVLDQNLDYHTSYELNETLAEWISANLIGNLYVGQTGKDSFEITKKNDGTISYFVGVSYLVDEEAPYRNYYIQDVSFVTDADSTKLLSFAIDYELHIVNLEDPEDTADEVYQYGGTITYGEKGENNVSDKITPYNYFLQDITEVQLLDSSRKDIANDKVTIGSRYLFAKPKTYSPSLALHLSEDTLTRVSTSDATVVSLTDDGYFEVMSTGTANLTFSYFGLDLNTKVWRNKSISTSVTVVTATPESITVSPLLVDAANAGATYSFTQLKTNHTYYANVVISPTDASQDITFQVADPSILEVTSVSDVSSGNIAIKALKEGTTTITFASSSVPSVQKTCTFTVQPELASQDTVALLKGKTFTTTKSVYNITEKLIFANDGTSGTVQVLGSSGSVAYEFSFTFTATNNNLAFTFTKPEDVDSDVFNNYVFNTGVVASDGKSIQCENNTSYKSFAFTLVA